jgi:Reverse transcriptase (RNA-dependent DNA polymerase)
MANDQSRRQFLQSTAGVGFGIAGLPAFPVEESYSKSSAVARQISNREDVHAAVDRAIKVVMADGIDDVFPKPFELGLLADADLTQAIRFRVVESLTSGSPAPGLPAAYIPWPKNDPKELRRCTLIDPYDAIAFLALALLIAQKTEPSRLPVSSNKIFSYRFLPGSAPLFDARYNAEAFHAETLARLPEEGKTYLVRTDIENFYPQIAHDRLRSILESHHVDGAYIEAVLNFLARWQDMNGRGLPVGPDASHVLAEVALIEVDRELVSSGVNYVRFVDDFRLFAPDAATAQAWLDLLSRSLAREQLTLKAKKTAVDVVSRSDYADMWAIRHLGPLSAKGEFAQQNPPNPASGSRRRNQPRGQSNVDALKRVVAEDLFLQIQQSDCPDLRDVRMVLEASYQRGEFALLEKSIGLFDKSPNVMPYFADLLIQESASIPPATRQRIAEALGARLNGNSTIKDYEIICITRILAAEPYRNAQAIDKFVSSMFSRSSSSVTTRFALAAIVALDAEIDASAMTFFEDRFDAAETWERRVIARLLLPRMSEVRRSAFVKRRSAGIESDLFLQSIVALYGGEDPHGRGEWGPSA